MGQDFKWYPGARRGRMIGVRIFMVMAATLSLVGSPSPVLARQRGVPDLTKEGLPNIQSQSALVIDLSTDSILLEREADFVRPIASVSKLMAAIVIHEKCRLEPEQQHVMSTANRDAAKGGDKSKLTTGWAFSHRDLMHAALMRSDNRALPALGEACGMTPAELGEKMTEKSRQLGLRFTTFREPNGLSSENVSTAREVMVFLKAAMRIPELVAIMTTQEHEITGYRNGRQHRVKIRNTDRMLTRDSIQILGGKTGYTDPARYCLAIAVRSARGRELGMVFLGAEGRHTRFADFTRVYKWIHPGEQLKVKPRLSQTATASAPTAIPETPTAKPADTVVTAPALPPATDTASAVTTATGTALDNATGVAQSPAPATATESSGTGMGLGTGTGQPEPTPIKSIDPATYAW